MTGFAICQKCNWPVLQLLKRHVVLMEHAVIQRVFKGDRLGELHLWAVALEPMSANVLQSRSPVSNNFGIENTMQCTL